MRSLICAGLTVLAAAFLTNRPAIAGHRPSAFYSSIPPVLTVCPAGDMVFGITLRDFANRPLPDDRVYLQVLGCPTLAPLRGDERYAVGQNQETWYIWQATDASARVNFAIRAGGPCPAPGMWLHAGGIILTRRPLASPDQDGDLVVSESDHTVASAKLGTGDQTADFDGDGIVTAADLDILRAHLGHQPGDATPVASRSWGAIKRLFR